MIKHREFVILIVEDEPLLRQYAVSIIEDAGFEAIDAKNADDAVLLLESRSDIRVVFTDIEMPGSMDGLKLARAIRGRWPPIHLILTSGRAALKAEDLMEGVKFFPKPYRPDEIIGALLKLAA